MYGEIITDNSPLKRKRSLILILLKKPLSSIQNHKVIES
jgi:hypothetical protein